jgi:hypothetical protein
VLPWRGIGTPGVVGGMQWSVWGAAAQLAQLAQLVCLSRPSDGGLAEAVGTRAIHLNRIWDRLQT